VTPSAVARGGKRMRASASDARRAPRARMDAML